MLRSEETSRVANSPRDRAALYSSESKQSKLRQGRAARKGRIYVRDNQTADAACSACVSRARDFAPRVKRKKAGGVIFISNFAHLISSLFSLSFVLCLAAGFFVKSYSAFPRLLSACSFSRERFARLRVYAEFQPNGLNIFLLDAIQNKADVQ